MLFLILSSFFSFAFGSISVEQTHRQTSLLFPTQSKMAVFYLDDTWFAYFETKDNLSLPVDGVLPFLLKEQALIKVPTGIVLTFQTPPYLGFKIKKEKRGWRFDWFYHSSLRMILENKPQDSSPLFSSKNPGRFLRINGRDIFVIPSQKEETAYLFSVINPSARPLYSLQGQAFEVLSSFFSFKKQGCDYSLPLQKEELFLDWRGLSFFRNCPPLFKKEWKLICALDGKQALSLLDVHLYRQPLIRFLPWFQKLKGLSCFLSGKYTDALKEWRLLPSYEEVELWRSLALFLSGQIHKLDLEKIKAYLLKCPPKIAALTWERLTPYVGSQGIYAQTAWFNLERFSSITPLMRELHAFYTAKIVLTQLGSHAPHALMEFEKIMNTPQTSPLIKNKATFEWTDHKIQSQSLSSQEGIAQLEKLRFYHRHEDFEFPITTYLCQIYLKNNQHKQALYLLDQLQRLYPHRCYIENIQGWLYAILLKVFDQKDIHPVRLIAIYDEFFSVLKSSDKRYTLTKFVAEKLSALGLLDSAADLYAYSVEDEKDIKRQSVIYLEMAKLYYEMETFSKALRALECIDEACLPVKERALKIRLQADIFYHLKKEQKAHTLLYASPFIEHKEYLAKRLITRKKYKEARTILELLLHQNLKPDDRKRIEKVFLSLKKDDENLENLENLENREDAETVMRKISTFIEESQKHTKK